MTKFKGKKKLKSKSKPVIGGFNSGRNEVLVQAIAKKPVNKRLKASVELPKPDAVNLSGNAAYKLDPFTRLIAILNISKVEDGFYKSASAQLKEVINLIDIVGKKDALLLAKMIVYSRCYGAGMRSINHFAAAYAAKYISGNKWAKRFYSARSRKENTGGTIYRLDDMDQILAVYTDLNSGAMPNSMKKGFRETIETADSYVLLKYKKAVLDICNLVHPDPTKSTAAVEVGTQVYRDRLRALRESTNNKVLKARYDDKLDGTDGRNRVTVIKTLDAIMLGLPTMADTHEAVNSEAGQIVAKAIREGQIDKKEANELLIEAKSANWAGLLKDNKLGILAAIRNIRNILSNRPDGNTLNLLCKLFVNPNVLRNGKILPFQLDIANEITVAEFGTTANGRLISSALAKGYELCIPNLKEALSGNTLLMIDLSQSMWGNNGNLYYGYSSKDLKRSTVKVGDKALLMAATIAKGVNADVIRFGSVAEYIAYDPNTSLFDLAKSWRKPMGNTNIAAAWDLARRQNKAYDRVILLSDYEANRNSTPDAYRTYVKDVANPYVYQIDLAMNGTVQLKGDKVRNYFGYSFETFDDIAKSEFNPNYHLEKVKAIHI